MSFIMRQFGVPSTDCQSESEINRRNMYDSDYVVNF